MVSVGDAVLSQHELRRFAYALDTGMAWTPTHRSDDQAETWSKETEHALRVNAPKTLVRRLQHYTDKDAAWHYAMWRSHGNTHAQPIGLLVFAALLADTEEGCVSDCLTQAKEEVSSAPPANTKGLTAREANGVAIAFVAELIRCGAPACHAKAYTVYMLQALWNAHHHPYLTDRSPLQSPPAFLLTLPSGASASEVLTRTAQVFGVTIKPEDGPDSVLAGFSTIALQCTTPKSTRRLCHAVWHAARCSNPAQPPHTS